MNRKELGNLGEEVAVNYLIAQGLEIVELNYFNKKGYCQGEIDIIAKDKEGEFVFVEVKTRKGSKDDLVPEENIGKTKIIRLQKAITWFFNRKGILDADWRIDAVSVIVDFEQKKFHIKHIKYIRF